MTTHQMNLQPKYFDFIKNGTKRIELRLYDESASKLSSVIVLNFQNQRMKNSKLK